MISRFFRHAATVTGALLCLHAQGQTPPDAGRTFQQLQPPTAAPPRPAGQVPSAPVPAAAAATQKDDVTVMLQSVRFDGNTRLDADILRAALGVISGNTYTLAGLRELTQTITLLYRDSGYPFARAYLPQQELQDGDLTIAVIEGRYGSVQTHSEDARFTQAAQAYVTELHPGDVIEGEALQRSLLLLEDLPGITISPVMQPGQVTGTGDLDIQVARPETVSGEFSLDNSGNRYTGRWLARGGVRINSAFTFGDQITLRGLTSNGELDMASVGYSMPLGSDGWRAQGAYARTNYALGKEFANLDARGSAEVGSLGVSYPLLRSQSRNVSVAVGYQVKLLHDTQGATNTQADKSSRSLPLSLQFDQRDTFGGAAVTYGNLTWTAGDLKLHGALRGFDALRTEGGFGKLNLDLVRLQSLPGRWNLMGRLSTQWANKNLDSSEKMSLGGPGSVRAFPTGEASGDEAWLAQIELRYNAGAWSPYLFVDSGHVRTNAEPLANTPDNGRSLGGAGVGARYQHGKLSVDASLAWRTHGGVPQADAGKDPKPRAWLTLAYRF